MQTAESAIKSKQIAFDESLSENANASTYNPNMRMRDVSRMAALIRKRAAVHRGISSEMAEREAGEGKKIPARPDTSASTRQAEFSVLRRARGPCTEHRIRDRPLRHASLFA